MASARYTSTITACISFSFRMPSGTLLQAIKANDVRKAKLYLESLLRMRFCSFCFFCKTFGQGMTIKYQQHKYTYANRRISQVEDRTEKHKLFSTHTGTHSGITVCTIGK